MVLQLCPSECAHYTELLRTRRMGWHSVRLQKKNKKNRLHCTEHGAVSPFLFSPCRPPLPSTLREFYFSRFSTALPLIALPLVSCISCTQCISLHPFRASQGYDGGGVGPSSGGHPADRGCGNAPLPLLRCCWLSFYLGSFLFLNMVFFVEVDKVYPMVPHTVSHAHRPLCIFYFLWL